MFHSFFHPSAHDHVRTDEYHRKFQSEHDSLPGIHTTPHSKEDRWSESCKRSVPLFSFALYTQSDSGKNQAPQALVLRPERTMSAGLWLPVQSECDRALIWQPTPS